MSKLKVPAGFHGSSGSQRVPSVLMSPSELAAPTFSYRAYCSEPITRCPVREKGRIRTLVGKIQEALEKPPYNTVVYIPSMVTAPEVRGQMVPEHVYLLDRIRVVEADYMLVLADHTSFGIGGEVEMATSLGKPVIIFSRAKTLSRFLTGTPCNAVREHAGALDELPPEGGQHYIYYRDWRDLKRVLLPLVGRILSGLKSDEAENAPIWDFGKHLRKHRQQRGFSQEELARRAGVRVYQLKVWEMSIDQIATELNGYEASDENIALGPVNLTPRQMEQLTNPGLAALHRLAFALEIPVTALFGESGSQGRRPPRGPSKRVKIKLEQMRASREASLAARAEQFDVTFRQYQQLFKVLIEEKLSQPELLQAEWDRGLAVISESEFMDALQALLRH